MMPTRAVLATLVAASLLATAEDARADKFDETLDISLHYRASWFEAKDLGLSPSPGYDQPDLEAGAPRLTGVGRGHAAVVRANLSIDGFRFGLGTGLMTVDGLELASDAGGVTAGRLWGAPAEAFLGYAFGRGREVRPFLEARGTLDVMQLGLSTSRGDVSAPFNAYAPGLGLRAGVLVPLNEYFFVDTGLGLGIVGPQRVSIDVGLGLPIPLANL